MGNGDPIRGLVTLGHKNGLHLTPITALVQQTSKLNADVSISFNGKVASAGSAVELMLLGATHGAQLDVEASGEQAEQALAAVRCVLESPVD